MTATAVKVGTSYRETVDGATREERRVVTALVLVAVVVPGVSATTDGYLYSRR